MTSFLAKIFKKNPKQPKLIYVDNSGQVSEISFLKPEGGTLTCNLEKGADGKFHPTEVLHGWQGGKEAKG